MAGRPGGAEVEDLRGLGPQARHELGRFQAGMKILLGRIHRLATSGRLRVDEDLAASLIHATARGAVLTWLSLPDATPPSSPPCAKR
ncbi:hypothetical protein [Amycolatopsis sp. NPDC051128]|uniref:hypothetical protein n=1 Tax=Amycolatopsis sp. NPDC051128 TaxID=3155412 RepID=UPI00343BF220